MSSSELIEDDLQEAIAMSLRKNSPQQDTSLTATGHVEQVAAHKDPSTNMGLAGLNRKAMEEERLARHQQSRKRQRSVSPPPPRESRKFARVETVVESTTTLASGVLLKSFSSLVQTDQQARKSLQANAANGRLSHPVPLDAASEPTLTAFDNVKPLAELQYPLGVVKKTWAFGHARQGNDVKLEEVLEPHSVRTAVLSAFQWDIRWVLAKLKTPMSGGQTKCVFVMQAKDEVQRQQMLSDIEKTRSFLRLCFPSMVGQINCMHSKLMLLFHPHKLRVAIPTANLLNFDWGETGQMENTVFMIDLPRLSDGDQAKREDLTDFGRELLYFVEKQELDADIRAALLNFDYAATGRLAFVHTVGGASFAGETDRTGFPGLSQAVCKLGLHSDKLEIDFAASSIGSLNDEYLRGFHAAAKGDGPISSAEMDASSAKANFFKPSANPERVKIREQMRIYFPTHETVIASTAGGAGTICISRKYWENMPFPRACFRDYKSLRPGMLSHNKILYARGKRRDGSGRLVDVAWAYVGSANMSESAWGKLVYDKKAKQWKINCRNWECGVLLPVCVQTPKLAQREVNPAKPEVDGDDSETESEDETEPDAKLVGMEVFCGAVDPPFEYPGALYNGKEPWYFLEQPR